MGSTSPDARLSFGPFCIDPQAATLRRHDEIVPLRPKCFDLLCLLASRPGQLVSKSELFERLWPKVVVTEDALSRAMSDLRDALGEAGRTAIRTVHRRGYVFAWPVQLDAAGAAPPADDAPAAEPAWPVAREPQLSELERLVARSRLVTVAGPAGVGKSHLARWYVRSQAARFEHGAVEVNLDQVDEGGRVVERVLVAFGLSAVGSGGVVELVGALRPLKAIVLLDNAEHLVEAVAEAAAALAAGAAGLRMVVTSQRPLHVAAEQVFKLLPLEVPPPGPQGDSGHSAGDAHDALRFGALALLHDRLARIGSPARPQDHAHLRRICRRTDGLPLALELAAARVAQFGARRAAELLDESLDLLDATRRDAPARHRSVRAAVQWSVSLLSAPQRVVLGRTGVFVGGFTLDAALQVIAGEDLSDRAVLEHVGSLVDASLISHDAATGRYAMLEAVRLVARELLGADARAQAVRNRHLRCLVRQFDDAYQRVAALAEPFDVWRERLLADADNAHAACRFAASGGERAAAVGLAAGLAQVMGGEWPQERRRTLEQAGHWVDATLPAPGRARWLLANAQARVFSDPALAHGWAGQAAELFIAQDDRLGRYLALTLLVHCASIQPSLGSRDRVAALSAAYDPGWSAMVRAEGANALACWHSASGDFQRCIAWRRRTLALYAQAGCAWREHAARSNLVDTLLASGDAEAAAAQGTELLAALAGTRLLWALPAVRLNLAAAHLHRGDIDGAVALVAEGWAQAVMLGWQGYWADHLALLAALQGRPEAAASLLGYADARYRHGGAEREVNEARSEQRARLIAIAALGVEAFGQRRGGGELLDDRGAGELAVPQRRGPSPAG
jgi:predicted ATPase/DNA-binding winged helix-turn-helix (wHTH) protein